MRKQYIQGRFEASLNTYERNATVQAYIAEHLFDKIRENLTKPPKRILEIGCGTGLLTRRLRHEWPDAELFANDLNGRAKEMLNGLDVHFLPGDAEKIDLPDEVDLIVSSSVFHWFEDLKQFFKRARLLLNDEGRLAFSSFGEDNMMEIRQTTGVGLEYFGLGEMEERLLDAGFLLGYSEEANISSSFPTPLDVLRHLKLTGVNAIARSVWTRSKLALFTEEYLRSFSCDGGVRLSYHPLYLIGLAAR